jgi:hypothetical protein
MIDIIVIVVMVGMGTDISQILFEHPADRLSVLVDDQAPAMGQDERALFTQKARRTNVQYLVWIDKDLSFLLDDNPRTKNPPGSIKRTAMTRFGVTALSGICVIRNFSQITIIV